MLSEFRTGDRVEHPTLGEGVYISSHFYLAYEKAWVSFEDHRDLIAVSVRHLKSVEPGPKPEPHLALRGNKLTLIDYYRNYGGDWCSYDRKGWTNNIAEAFRIPLSEITEALDE